MMVRMTADLVSRFGDAAHDLGELGTDPAEYEESRTDVAIVQGLQAGVAVAVERGVDVETRVARVDFEALGHGLDVGLEVHGESGALHVRARSKDRIQRSARK